MRYEVLVVCSIVLGLNSVFLLWLSCRALLFAKKMQNQRDAYREAWLNSWQSQHDASFNEAWLNYVNQRGNPYASSPSVS